MRPARQSRTGAQKGEDGAHSSTAPWLSPDAVYQGQVLGLRRQRKSQTRGLTKQTVSDSYFRRGSLIQRLSM